MTATTTALWILKVVVYAAAGGLIAVAALHFGGQKAMFAVVGAMMLVNLIRGYRIRSRAARKPESN